MIVGSGMAWAAPVPLETKVHDRQAFECGTPALDEWVKRYAAQSHAAGTSRVFVSAPLGEPSRIAGIYGLHLGGVSRAEATVAAAKGSPDPVPAVVLGRMAVDRKFQGLGLGSALLHDVLLRTLVIADNAGAKVLLVHAKDENAQSFYRHHGFEPSPIDAMTLMLLVQDIRGAFRAQG